MMDAQDINQVPIVADGRLVGLLSRELIIRYLQERQSLKEEERRFSLLF
jgi:predicted transcriptional regulator